MTPINMVTEMYALPAYRGIDPNPLIFWFFLFFFGFMFADVAYGIIIWAVSFIIWKSYKPKGTMGYMVRLGQYMGISTFICGVFTGGFFGDFLTQLAQLIHPESTFALPALFTPLNDTMMILVGAMCLGFVQIITGMAISFIRKLRRGQLMDAVWEEVTWWVVFAGIALAILGVTNWVLIAGGVMVLVGSGWNAKGFGKITAVFGSLYNHITGYFGDILSYSRLMALMLAGSVIAQVFNTLGAIPGNVVFFIVVSLAGNTLNFALNLLGLNVTVPYKSDVIPYLTDIDPLAENIGAVNTLVRTETGYKGYNTDMPGLYRAMCEDGVKVKGEKVLILGAGGVARAVAMLLLNKGAREAILLNRTVQKAQEVADEVNRIAGRKFAKAMSVDTYDTLPAGKQYLAIQATSVGMYPHCDAAVIEDPAFYEKIHTGYDLIFNPPKTRFMELVEAQGGKAYNGAKMLLYQGIIAFELWTGCEVESWLADKVYERMQEAKKTEDGK